MRPLGGQAPNVCEHDLDLIFGQTLDQVNELIAVGGHEVIQSSEQTNLGARAAHLASKPARTSSPGATHREDFSLPRSGVTSRLWQGNRLGLK